MNRNEYIENNLTLAKNVAYRMNGRHAQAQFDDVLSYANLGLILAADTYETNRGSSFQTYAYHCIRGSIIDGLRQEKVIHRIRRKDYQPDDGTNRKVAISVATPLKGMDNIYLKPNMMMSKKSVYFDDHEGLEPSDMQAPLDVEKEIDLKKKRKMLMRALKRLPKKMRQLLVKHYFQNKTLKEAGAEMNLSKSWASRLHDRAIAQLSTHGDFAALAV
ncbi:MAG: sigma-70 family RNA polymerase sigma factor [bacterium]